LECGSYTGIKLLENSMKVVKRIFEYIIWQQTEIEMQFEFMKGKANTDAISIARQMHENSKLKERSSIFVLWIWKITFNRFREK